MAKKEQEIEKKEAAKKETAKKENQKKASKKDKASKPNFFVRLGKKIKETFSELKRVTWPTLPNVLKATGIVLAIVVVFLVVVTGINLGFEGLLDLLLLYLPKWFGG